MTVEVMRHLERRGLIYRISPDKAIHDGEPGGVALHRVYVSSEESGPHSLLLVSFDKTRIDQLETHTDCEDWLLIGPETDRKAYLVLSALSSRDLARRVSQRSIAAEDFVVLEAVFNDCSVSFFTIMKGVPHTVVVEDGAGERPGIFVGLSSALPTEFTDVSPFSLEIRK